MSPIDQALQALRQFRGMTRDEAAGLVARWTGAWLLTDADLRAVLAEFPTHPMVEVTP